jgi:hypothetical protein
VLTESPSSSSSSSSSSSRHFTTGIPNNMGIAFTAPTARSLTRYLLVSLPTLTGQEMLTNIIKLANKHTNYFGFDDHQYCFNSNKFPDEMEKSEKISHLFKHVQDIWDHKVNTQKDKIKLGISHIYQPESDYKTNVELNKTLFEYKEKELSQIYIDNEVLIIIYYYYYYYYYYYHSFFFYFYFFLFFFAIYFVKFLHSFN